MILVYSSQQSSRMTYVFQQLFRNVLEVEMSFTNAIDAFVAYEGPKFTYATVPFGETFFVEAHPLLFEHGISPQQITFSTWKTLPIFFQTSKRSKIPFDVFAASFFLLTRYEEHLPYVKNEKGQFDPQQSIAAQGQFLERPMIDLWMLAFYNELRTVFPNLPLIPENKVQFTPLFQINNPFRFKFKSILGTLVESGNLIWSLDFQTFFQQLLVVLRIKQDPHATFPQLLKVLCEVQSPLFFFSHTYTSDDASGISPHNKKYQSFVKHVADFAKSFLLIQAPSHPLAEDVLSQKEGLTQLIHRSIHAVRIKNGYQHYSEDYDELVEKKFSEDYSMGYSDCIGFRASTAVPYYYFNLKEEYQTPLKLVPVVATTAVLKTSTPEQFSRQLNALQEEVCLNSSQLFCVMTLRDLNFEALKKQPHIGILNYFSTDAST